MRQADHPAPTARRSLKVDVVVPVYRSLAATRRCLDSVLAGACRTAHEIVVIDDGSPEPDLSDWLRARAAAGTFTLLVNEDNLGFVATANRGIRLHPDRDVVLLNSDTEVANAWLDRLAACARSEPDIATATPFSNNATICSYPFEGWAGGLPGHLGLAALDALFSRIHAGLRVDLPTAVGFCMYIRRDCIDRVGLFDEERFGRGYGEENDFCMRAAATGLRHVLAADVFVFHEGSASFGDDREELQRAAMATLLRAHPTYLDLVHDFLRRDPVQPLREAIDRARAASSAREEQAVHAEQALRPRRG
jgi:GT2 family glycosyltransferase